MQNDLSRRLAGVAAALSLLAVIACKSESPTHGKDWSVMVGGTVSQVVDYDNYVHNATAFFAYAPVIPHVTVNGDTIRFQVSSGYSLAPFSYLDTTRMLIPGADESCKIDYIEGVCRGAVKVPSRPVLVQSSPYVIAKGQAASFSWTNSLPADWYYVSLYVYYEYLDMNGYYEYFTLDTGMVATQTEVTFSAALIWPQLSQIDSVQYGGGFAQVAAVNGPIPQPGSYGNITGDGAGFYLGAQTPREVQIEIAGAARDVSRERRPQPLDFVDFVRRAVQH